MKVTDSKLFNITSLSEMLDGDMNAVSIMLTKFVELSPRLLEEINKSFENRNFERVKKIAHEMKPSIDILNIESLKSDIRLIEKDSMDASKHEELKTLITKLNNIYTCVLKEIADMIY